MGIIIEWPTGTTEYLDDIDPDDLGRPQRFDTTSEWWPDEDDFVEYTVKANIKPLNGGVVVVVKYARDQNRELDRRGLNNAYWGKNKITIEAGNDHGSCLWSAKNGERFECEWRTEKLREPRDRRRSHQQIRDAKFRSQILALDKRCVISGETTRAALDAAHIVPAAKDSNEIRRNGIALRADIHRLYDAGMFVIHPTGSTANIDPNLSQTYRELLEGKRLPDETLDRVTQTLTYIWENLGQEP